MVETSEKLNYAHWDEPDFSLPKELILKENSFLHEAISVFYVAGGYDFFKVVDPKKYATGWLDFLGNLYTEIMAGKYKKDINRYENPLSDSERISLIEQGVPNIFTEKIIEIKATIIYLEDSVLLSKKEYDNWKDCQDEYYEKYKTNLSPMSYEEISSFFAEDFGQEEEWPFSKKEILQFFESEEMVIQSER